jgi:hypothetical protein
VRQRHGDLGETEPRAAGDAATGKPLRVIKGAVVTVCLAVTLTHVLLVFLHVAPLNPISQRYNKQIAAWIYPFFQQNWLLFAPNPDANRTQIFAKTEWVTASGDGDVSDWFDISAADWAGTRHDPYPSRTTQHMLRRAWNAYMSSHGEDEVSHDAWSLVWEKYLRNIAVQRVAPHSPHPFQRIRLKVVTQPIAAPAGAATTQTYSTYPQTRLLPWWNVTPDGS